MGRMQCLSLPPQPPLPLGAAPRHRFAHHHPVLTLATYARGLWGSALCTFSTIAPPSCRKLLSIHHHPHYVEGICTHTIYGGHMHPHYLGIYYAPLPLLPAAPDPPVPPSGRRHQPWAEATGRGWRSGVSNDLELMRLVKGSRWCIYGLRTRQPSHMLFDYYSFRVWNN